MAASLQTLCAELAKLHDSPPEIALSLIQSHFNEHAASIRSQVAKEVFSLIASDYILVKRPHSILDMKIKHTVSGQAPLTTLRQKQRFIVETHQNGADRSTTTQSRNVPDLTIGTKEPVIAGFVKKDVVANDASNATISREMRKFSRLARGGHLLAKGAAVESEPILDSYSSIYDTREHESWQPKAWFRGRDPSRAQTPNVLVYTSTPDNKSPPKSTQLSLHQTRPSSGFAAYVKQTQHMNAI